ncbi:MAG TPA: hypothetical protein VHV47_05920 [Opitutaceae bacterium]|jgi:type II secretory pathway pseudopilin PulG|nr:hypothetical protein [Opitutaceae bacterium]
MNLIRRLIRNRSYRGRDHKIRGLSTAELVGIIIIVGILGAIGGTYIGSLVNSADTNAIAQNCNSLNTVCASMLSGGIVCPVTGGNVTAVGTNPNFTTPTDPTELLQLINAGVADPKSGVTYQMNPQISAKGITAKSYVATAVADASGNASAITWAPAAGATTP